MNEMQGITLRKMNLNKEKKRNMMFVFVIVFGLMVVVPIIAQADSSNPNPGVLPPNSKPYGLTYGEWSAKWWQWAFSIQTPDNPLVDSNGSNAANGQQGPVWFLAGKLCLTACEKATADRTVNVPAGKAIFFPIMNVECSEVEGNGNTDEALRTCAKDIMNLAKVKEADVDGMQLRDFQKYRKDSPLFTFTLPQDNILGIQDPPASSLSVSDGIWVMLAPLSEGKHTIHFAGDFVSDGTVLFELDIHYTINVVPKRM